MSLWDWIFVRYNRVFVITEFHCTIISGSCCRFLFKQVTSEQRPHHTTATNLGPEGGKHTGLTVSVVKLNNLKNEVKIWIKLLFYIVQSRGDNYSWFLSVKILNKFFFPKRNCIRFGKVDLILLSFPLKRDLRIALQLFLSRVKIVSSRS